MSYHRKLTLFVGLVVPACVAQNKFADRYAEVMCAKFEECSSEAVFEDCEAQTRVLAEDIVDECEDYKGGLAYRCLKDVEKASCGAEEQSEDCEEFDQACGFDGEIVRDYGDGTLVRGLVRIELPAADPG